MIIITQVLVDTVVDLAKGVGQKGQGTHSSHLLLPTAAGIQLTGSF